MGFRDVVDLSLDVKMDVSRGLRMNDRLDGLSSGVNLDASRGLRMSDLLVDRNLDASSDGNLYRRTNEPQDDLNLDDVRHGLTMGDDLMTDVNLCHRMNDRLDDRKMVATKDVNHRDVLVGHCNYALDDQNLDVSHVNRNYARHDRNLDVSHANRNCVRRDRSLGVMMDGNRGHHMSDLLVDRNLVLKMDAMSHHAK
jgi:hypothetical protein